MKHFCSNKSSSLAKAVLAALPESNPARKQGSGWQHTRPSAISPILPTTHSEFSFIIVCFSLSCPFLLGCSPVHLKISSPIPSSRECAWCMRPLICLCWCCPLLARADSFARPLIPLLFLLPCLASTGTGRSDGRSVAVFP